MGNIFYSIIALEFYKSNSPSSVRQKQYGENINYQAAIQNRKLKFCLRFDEAYSTIKKVPFETLYNLIGYFFLFLNDVIRNLLRVNIGFVESLLGTFQFLSNNTDKHTMIKIIENMSLFLLDIYIKSLIDTECKKTFWRIHVTLCYFKT